MTYDPNLPTVRSKILDNILATLGAIIPPTFGTNAAVGTVRLWDADAFHVTNYPGFLLVPLVDTPDDTLCSALLAHEMTVGIVLAVQGQDWDQQMRQAIADVEVAMLADTTRGNNAAMTRLVSTEVYDASPTAPVGAGQMIFSINYRTAYGDPTEPH